MQKVRGLDMARKYIYLRLNYNYNNVANKGVV